MARRYWLARITFADFCARGSSRRQVTILFSNVHVMTERLCHRSTPDLTLFTARFQAEQAMKTLCVVILGPIIAESHSALYPVAMQVFTLSRLFEPPTTAGVYVTGI